MSTFEVIRNFGSKGKGFSSPDNYIIRTVKIVHIFGAAAWIGGALALQALGYLQHTARNPEAAPWITLCLNSVDTWVVMPGLVMCIITGLFYSCLTAIGFFKHFWIAFKWIITISAAFWGFFFLSPLGDACLAKLASVGWDAPLRMARGVLFPDSWGQASLQLLVFFLMCVVSIYRPLSLEDMLRRFKPHILFGRKVAGRPMCPAKRISWFDPGRIAEALERRNAPDRHELDDILAKSRSLEVLTLPETVALMRVTDAEGVRLLLETADQVKRKVYGDRIVMSAPLHVSNYCGSDCRYCAYRKSNSAIQRKHLNQDELRTAALNIVRQGLSRVFLVTGQFPGADVKLLVNAVRALYSVREGNQAIRRINVNVGPLESAEYAALQKAEVGTILIYQDTYHEPSYHAVHPIGPKSDYEKRLTAPDVAHDAGVGDAGLGIVLGLGPWQYDMLGLIMHATHLMEAYGTGCRSVSMHRLRPAPGCDFPAPYPVSDATYMRCIAVARLAIPYTSLILTSKEPAGLWHRACVAGGSHLLTGSVANPYEAWQNGLDHIPFPLGENGHVDEIVRTLLESGLLPSFCTACPRVGRKGDRFTSLAAIGGLKERCDFNSFTTCFNYLLHVAKVETRESGLKIINARLADMPEALRSRITAALEKITHGADESLV